MKINFKRLLLSILIVYLIVVLVVMSFLYNFVSTNSIYIAIRDLDFIGIFVSYPLVMLMYIPTIVSSYSNMPYLESMLVSRCYFICEPTILGWLLIIVIVLLPIILVYWFLSKIKRK